MSVRDDALATMTTRKFFDWVLERFDFVPSPGGNPNAQLFALRMDDDFRDDATIAIGENLTFPVMKCACNILHGVVITTAFESSLYEINALHQTLETLKLPVLSTVKE